MRKRNPLAPGGGFFCALTGFGVFYFLTAGRAENFLFPDFFGGSRENKRGNLGGCRKKAPDSRGTFGERGLLLFGRKLTADRCS
jgi:hypothetical protein